jgi:hypothetical protein
MRGKKKGVGVGEMGGGGSFSKDVVRCDLFKLLILVSGSQVTKNFRFGDKSVRDKSSEHHTLSSRHCL